MSSNRGHDDCLTITVTNSRLSEVDYANSRFEVPIKSGHICHINNNDTSRQSFIVHMQTRKYQFIVLFPYPVQLNIASLYSYCLLKSQTLNSINSYSTSTSYTYIY